MTPTVTRSPLARLYIPGDMAHTSGRQSAVTRIVVHCTVSPCQRGGARGNASYFQSAGAGGLAPYVVDPGEIVQCADETTICWHAPPNAGSIGVELCDPQAGPPSRWQDADHQAMLRLAAPLFVDIAHRWNVPLTRIGPSQLLAGAQGITGHVDVSNAWHQSDHSDPGPDFPWGQFMALLGGQPGPVPAPHPAPTPAREDNMVYVTCVPSGTVYAVEAAGLRHIGPGEWHAGQLLIAAGLGRAQTMSDAQAAALPQVKA